MVLAESAPGEHPDVTEKTFTKYNSAQANTYNEVRRNYHPSVYDFVIEHHSATGGKFDTVLDVGCGPGIVTRTLAPHFKQAIGVDPSPALLDVARNHPSTPTNVTYHSSTSSTFTPSPIAPSTISLLTVANAAHWFPSMAQFYDLASQVLQPGGTLAIWCSGNIRAAPDLPNVEKIQAAMDQYLHVDLKDFQSEGSRLVQGGYADLPLPWGGTTRQMQRTREGEKEEEKGEEGGEGGDEGESSPKQENGFDRETFVRRQWGINEKFFVEFPGEDKGVKLQLCEQMLGTGSATTRWREAHPDLANTDSDIVKQLVAKIGQLLREAGVNPGEERVRGTASGVVLLFKKTK